MSFLRPEARAALIRWRLPLIGAGVVVLGLYWGLGSFGLLRWLGWVLVVSGAALAVTGIQQARFRQSGLGPGVVQVTEGQIAYFGPETGGIVATDLLQELAIVNTGTARHWALVHEGGPPVSIPSDAMGAEQLFDAFGALPGLSASSLVQAIHDPAPGRRIVWRRRADAQALLR